MISGERTHFGFSTIPLDEKQGLVDDVFERVAERYDVMNDLMSAGLHRLWKDSLAAMLPKLSQHRPYHHLDVAGGTGDVAFRVQTSLGPQAKVKILDINHAMLTVGRRRAAEKGMRQMDFVQGNAEALPFPDRHFDSYTIAFGIRNVPRIDAALREAWRVLKRGGRFLCLEFSSVDLPGLERLYDLYSFKIIPQLGQWVTGDGEPYRYLVESIRRFPKPAAFSHMMEQAGLSQVSHRPLSGNIVAIHSGWKI